ncbi:MAG: hypothetical protein KA712_15010 [Myxococcales bacterium]|nr:hypothetical protein [Myxococcales bacterium]
MSKSKEVPNMTPGRAVLLGLMNRYLSGLMDPFVTLLELHKLMYFAQEAGEQLRLKFEKGPYGPYAENLRQVLNRIEGHYVTGYGDGGDDPYKQLELVPGAVADAMKLLEAQQDTRARFERVAALLDGFETPFGMELLATVHWVVRAEGAEGADDIVGAVQRWNSRKQQFTRAQIEVAQERLQGQGWLS